MTSERLPRGTLMRAILKALAVSRGGLTAMEICEAIVADCAANDSTVAATMVRLRKRGMVASDHTNRCAHCGLKVLKFTITENGRVWLN